MTVEFQNFAIDIDIEDFVTGEKNFTQQISAPINPKYLMEDSIVTVPEIVV